MKRLSYWTTNLAY
jgi:hypothetical protein